jgi:hypothetical protein
MLRQSLTLVLFCSAAGGCAGLPLASVAGLAATSVSTGADVYNMGKLDSVDMMSLDANIGAVHQAVQDLKLTIQTQEGYKAQHWRCMIVDERGTRFRVYLEGRTERLCRTRVDVGVFGSEPTARLFLKRMRKLVPKELE